MKSKSKSIFFGFISRDPIVLVKILETLQPEIIYIFLTEFARKNNWHQSIKRHLERKKTIFPKFEFLQLTNNEEQPQHFFEKLKLVHEKTSDSTEIKQILIDQTTGLGILRAVLTTYFQNWARENNTNFSLTYANANNQNITRLDLIDNKNIKQHDIAVKIHYLQEPLIERLSLYTEDEINDNHFEVLNYKQQLTNPDQLMLKQFKNKLELRYWLTSYIECFYQNQVQQCLKNKRKSCITRFLQIKEELINKTQNSRLPETLKKELNKELEAFFEQKNSFSLTRHLQNFFQNKTDWLENEFVTNLKACFNRNQEQKQSKFLKEFKQNLLQTGREQLKNFRNEIDKDAKELLNQLKDEKEIFRNHFEDFKASYIPDAAAAILKQTSGFAFEDLLQKEVKRIINKNGTIRSKIEKVYANVKISQQRKVLIELDILLILKTGQTIALEAKTNHNNYNRKDMESRLKNLRDLLGAYTELIVIFPFNHKDVEAILSYDQEYFEKCWRFGIPDLQQWVWNGQVKIDTFLSGLSQTVF